MKRYLLHIFLLSLSSSISIWSARVTPGLFSVCQSDGTTLHVRGFGDEDFAFYMTTDNVLLFQQGKDFFIAQILNDGSLIPTKQLAHNPDIRTAQEKELVSMQNKQQFQTMLATNAKKARSRREPVHDSPYLLQHTGSPKIPVILVQFTDIQFTVENPYETFRKYLNAQELFDRKTEPVVGRNYGSVKRYFTDMSNGLFTPDFQLFDVVTLPHNLAYYGAGYPANEKKNELVRDALAAINDTVDFTPFDNDNDGLLDLVYLIYAGYSQSYTGNSTDCLWPTSGVVTANIEVDGKKVGRYGVNNELNFTPEYQASKGLRINGIGLFCHEFSHCLGLQDHYCSSGSEAERCVNQNMEYWDIMDAGEYSYNGYYPTAYTSWEKECFGWTVIDTLDTATDVTLHPALEGGKSYRIINDRNDKEYYIVENVQQKGWNKYLMGHGMLVLHVDYDQNQFRGATTINSTAGHPRMTIIPADNLLVPAWYIDRTVRSDASENVNIVNSVFLDRYNGQNFTSAMYMAEAAGDPFPGTGNVTELTDTSTPMAAVYSGELMGKPITDIIEGEDGVVYFKFMGGSDTGIHENTATGSLRTGNAYTLDGRRIANKNKNLNSGFYIIDGKKVIIH